MKGNEVGRPACWAELLTGAERGGGNCAARFEDVSRRTGGFRCIGVRGWGACSVGRLLLFLVGDLSRATESRPDRSWASSQTLISESAVSVLSEWLLDVKLGLLKRSLNRDRLAVLLRVLGTSR